FEHHSVISRDYTRWQFRRDFVIINIDVQMRQHGALGLHAPDPIQSLGHGKMARMGRVAERVEDPNVQPLQVRQGLLWQIVQIAGIGHTLDAKAKRVDITVNLAEGLEGKSAARSAYCDRGKIVDDVALHDRRIARSWRRLEAIIETLP